MKMLHNKKLYTRLLHLILLSLLCLKIKADPIYLFHYCTNTNTSTPNGLYQTNLNHLLSSLSSNSTTNEFSTDTTGHGSSAVYGLFLCRGDIGAKVCQGCVTFAIKDIVKKCPGGKEAIIWYDECFLHFSNRSFFGTVDERLRFALLNTGDVTDQTRFNQTLLAMMNETAAKAAKSGVGEKKYATKDLNFTVFQTLYTLVQCTPDLSGENCSRCLGDAIGCLPICCNGKQGGRQVFASCSVRYELYPFYNQTTPSLSPVPITKGKSKTSLIIAIPIVVICTIAFVFGCYYLVKIRSKKKKNSISMNQDNIGNEITTESLEFDLATIAYATNDFFIGNKLGKGGFGMVYKGILPNGQEIAVKRLSKKLRQGEEEFKNEVLVVAELQHRNLVRLLGFCLEGGEKLLVFEYLPNKSLDTFLYHSEKQGQLDWSKRYKIIGGIARGILYLHEDSRLRIIHRDLKASNVLLDAELNPKISDFGTARIFGVDQTRGNTSRIVGTYGYMAPEYAMHGHFSIKSDIYSFGVLILEIISGQKNCSFYYQSDFADDLLSYAWKLWKEGEPLKLLDLKLKDSYSENEVVRCIHIGLLCVQEYPKDRPTMSLILKMLNRYGTLPSVQQPAFYIPSGTKGYLFEEIPLSINEASISEFHPR